MDWNKNNPRYRRPGKRRKKSPRSGFFAALGAKFGTFLRPMGRKSPKGSATPKKLPQAPMTVEEVFDDLKISTPRTRGIQNEAPTPQPASPAAVLDVPPLPPREEEAVGEAEDFELAENLENDYLTNFGEPNTEIYEEVIFLDDEDEELEEKEGGQPRATLAEPVDTVEPAAEKEAVDAEKDASVQAEQHDFVAPAAEPAEAAVADGARRKRPWRKNSRPKPQAPWLKLAAMAAAVLIVLGGIVWAARMAGLFSGEVPTAKVATIPATSLPRVDTPPPGMFENYAKQEARAFVTEYTVEEGASLSQALEAVGLATRTGGAAIIECLTADGDLEVVRPGAVVRAHWLDEQKMELSRLEYHPASGDPPHVVRPGADGSFWRYKLGAPALTVTTAARGTVESSLWEAGSQVGLDAAIIMNMADIMASEIDFLSDIQKGDSFQVLYSRNYADGRPVGGVSVEMLHMSNKGTDYELYRYVNASGDVGYYDQLGRSSKKTFFNSPLQYTRISSGFSMNRLHPIYKVRRAHQGVDYAAPSGTPISSVADGVVTFAGWSGGYGRLITIKHDEVYSTMYAHQSRFAKGLKKGDRVAQGDLIGYVGASGTATGPHLDFRMKRNNTFIDPQTVLSKQEGRMLEAAEAQAFAQLVTSARNRMREYLEAAAL